MTADLRASQVSVLEWKHESFSTADIVIPVDNTITELSISVGSKGSGGSPKAYTSLIDPFGTYRPYMVPIQSVPLPKRNRAQRGFAPVIFS